MSNRAHKSPQVMNNGKSRATLRRLSSTVLCTIDNGKTKFLRTMLKPVQSFALVTIVFFALFGCEKKNDTPEYIPEGYYSGIFIFSEDTVFDAFIFHEDTFSEVPSGGVMHQKFPCIVEGTYVIQEGIIEFSILKHPEESSNCDPGILMSGSYEMILAGDKLEFMKGEGDCKQHYIVKKVTSSR